VENGGVRDDSEMCWPLYDGPPMSHEGRIGVVMKQVDSKEGCGAPVPV
jgi:hypothetical protein